MIQHQGVWLPDGETHLTKWMTDNGEIVDGKGTYQIKKLRKALEYVQNFRTAIDVGAHCGLWSMQTVKHFRFVCAFEPLEAHRECFKVNVTAPDENVMLYPCALGEAEGLVNIHTTPGSSGDSYVDGEGEIRMSRLDDFDWRDVDFIKIDTEGHELYVLRGAEQTLRRCRPVVLVEQKPNKAERYGLQRKQAIPYLQSLGYRQAAELGGDFVMVP